MLINDMNISNETINNYKDNKQILKDLSIRIKSGSCSLYDIVLYNILMNTKEEVKKIKLTNSKNTL